MSAPASLWRADKPLLLASGSTTRRDMLVAAGVPVEAIRPDLDERAAEAPLLRQGAAGSAIAGALACAKALGVSVNNPGRFVLGADQSLTCGGTIHHKPADLTGAEAQIAALAGRGHELHSAFVLACDGEIVAEGGETARMTMRPLSADFIAAYVAAAGPAILGSVGGYQVEGLGAQLFEMVEGDHFTILGLPLFAVLDALRELGLLAR
ncbi:septum formation inhibitor Maf [Bosea caraganae]|uniref:Nucleoside triphosphate pyrophosphatase n=1 Tax=Bosea caraganae TaxID=2763117 RepID=A0A370KZW0_9HYPH|nr:Maf family protein [Bosea caraganae]RDJ20531.1 septum formation inhibitor Maf [Bosea caraganae]RDJ28380.1 septum formation inhibitor Maf [Bosea caraganae]